MDGIRRIPVRFDHHLNGQAAGDLPGRLTTHPICNQENVVSGQFPYRVFRKQTDAVFVVRSYAADIALAKGLNAHGCPPMVNA